MLEITDDIAALAGPIGLAAMDNAGGREAKDSKSFAHGAERDSGSFSARGA
jgi:hypothetical protein